MGKLVDMTGQRFGRLVVVERATDDDSKSKEKIQHTSFWLCKCDCGNEIIASRIHLNDGHIRSCGCLHDEASKLSNRTHGMTNTRLHAVWTNMIQRCTNPKNGKYKNYGARGICVCNEWRMFENFYHWAIENGYDENAEFGKCTIDRINVNGNYCPENCRWVDNKTQMKNMTNNHWIEYNGEKHTLSEWEKLLGDRGKLFKSRIQKGWTVENAITAPYNAVRNRYKIICEGNKFYTVGECAEYYNVNPQTMRCWLNGSRIMPKKWVKMGLRKI